MLLEKDKSGLLLVDVQEKLTPLVQNAEAIVERCQWLLHLAAEFDVPVLVSEQYPKGLGRTVDPLRELALQDRFIEKINFSCYRAADCKQRLQAFNKKQWVIIGIETHVCVLQTALDLLKAGYEVFVVVDAVSARFELDHKYALKRMKQNGIQLVTSEMVFFEWVGQAGTEHFKALSKAYLQ